MKGRLHRADNRSGHLRFSPMPDGQFFMIWVLTHGAGSGWTGVGAFAKSRFRRSAERRPEILVILLILSEEGGQDYQDCQDSQDYPARTFDDCTRIGRGGRFFRWEEGLGAEGARLMAVKAGQGKSRWRMAFGCEGWDPTESGCGWGGWWGLRRSGRIKVNQSKSRQDVHPQTPPPCEAKLCSTEHSQGPMPDGRRLGTRAQDDEDHEWTRIKVNQSKSKVFMTGDPRFRHWSWRGRESSGSSVVKADQGGSRRGRGCGQLAGGATGSFDCVPFASRSGTSLRMTAGRRAESSVVKADQGGSRLGGVCAGRGI